MPMRIIAQGRRAYILAGYLYKRSKWSLQWSERYFVLTWRALHYFKRDRRELYGKERGQFLVEDMDVLPVPDKKCFQITNTKSGQTRLLKAPTEREYETWCRAFQDVLRYRNAQRAARAAAALGEGGGEMRAQCETTTDRTTAGGTTSSRESSMSQSQSQFWSRPYHGTAMDLPKHGSGQKSLQPGQEEPGAASTASTRRAPPMQSQSMRNLHTTTKQQPVHGQAAASGSAGTAASTPGAMSITLTPVANTSTVASSSSSSSSSTSPPDAAGPPPLSRPVSSPGSLRRAELSASQTHAASSLNGGSKVSGAASPSPESHGGYSSGMSATPLLTPSASTAAMTSQPFFPPLHATPSVLSSPPPSAYGTVAGHHHHHYHSFGQPSLFDRSGTVISPMMDLRSGPPTPLDMQIPFPPFHAGGVGSDPIIMVTVEGGELNAPCPQAASSSSSSTPSSPSTMASSSSACHRARIIAGTNVSWRSPLFIPSFTPSSTLHATLSDGSQIVLPRKALQKEVDAGILEGTKIVPLGGDEEQQEHGSGSQAHALERYRQHIQVLLNWQVRTSTLSKQEKHDIAISIAPACAFLLLLLLCLIKSFAASSSSGASRFFAPEVAILGWLWLLSGVAFVSHALWNRYNEARALLTSRQSWSVTFVSVIEQPLTAEASAAATIAASRELQSVSQGTALNAVSSTSAGGSVGGVASGSGRKKKGILRRRADDLPPPTLNIEPSPMSATNTIVPLSSNISPFPPAAHPSPLRGDVMLHDFESEFSDSGASETSRRSSMRGELSSASPSLISDTLRHRRSRHRTSGDAHSGDELDTLMQPTATKSSALPAKASHAEASNTGHDTMADASSASPSPSLHDKSGESSAPEMLRLNSASTSVASHPSPVTRDGSGSSLGVVSVGSNAPSEMGSEHTDADSRDWSGDDDDAEHEQDYHDAAEGEEEEGAQAAEGAVVASRPSGLSPLETAALADALASYEDHPPTPSSTSNYPGTPMQAPWGFWSEDDTSALVLRGPTFLQDKIKIPAGVPIFKLLHVDMFYTPMGTGEPLLHVAKRPGNWAYKYFERREKKWREMLRKKKTQNAGGDDGGDGDEGDSTPSPFSNPTAPMIIINFLFPGPGSKNMNLVLYFMRRVRPAEELRARLHGATTAPPSAASSRRTSGTDNIPPFSTSSASSSSSSLFKASSGASTPALSPTSTGISSLIDIDRVAGFDGLLRRFVDGSDEFRDCRFKIIPRIAAGPWLVKKGVGCVPAILGKKVTMQYFRNVEKNYLEIVSDVSSSVVAGRILALCKGASTALTIDLSFTLQGEAPEELPESLLGGVRIMKCNLDQLLEVGVHERRLAEQLMKEEEQEA